MKAVTLLLVFVSTVFSSGLCAVSDPQNYLPVLDQYLSEEFTTAFEKTLFHEYQNKTCYKSRGCIKANFTLLVTPFTDGFSIEMKKPDGTSLGSKKYPKEYWLAVKKNIFRHNLEIQKQRYNSLRIEAVNDVEELRVVDGQRVWLIAKEVVVGMKTRQGKNINKVFTFTNELPGFARLLGIFEKHDVKKAKTVLRINENFQFLD